jgi:hypothetical protein
MAFIPNLKAIDELAAQVRRSQAVAEMLDDAKAAAESASPELTGAYKDAFEVAETDDGLVLQNTDWKAAWIEFGSVHNPVSAPLRRGVEAAGFELRGSSK